MYWELAEIRMFHWAEIRGENGSLSVPDCELKSTWMELGHGNRTVDLLDVCIKIRIFPFIRYTCI